MANAHSPSRAPGGPKARSRRVRAIIAAWRALTGGRAVRDARRRTLVACSGGADSSALAIALAAAAPKSIILAHVIHDMRDQSLAFADRDVARTLATQIGVGFAEISIAIRDIRGNAEANARLARYRALESLALDTDCPYIATGHHADDQLETVLMRLVRGAGPRGLAAIAEARPLRRGTPSPTLIRPLLAASLTHLDCETICLDAGWSWALDHTNSDTTRLRALLRSEVIPALCRAAPHAAARASAAARLARDSAGLLLDHSLTLMEQADTRTGHLRWIRRDLICSPDAVLGEMLAIAARSLTTDQPARLSTDGIRRAVRAIRAGATRRTRVQITRRTTIGQAVAVTVTSAAVCVGRADENSR